MRQSESIAQLAADLAKAQGELKNASFNATNPHFKNKYADLAQLRDCTAPVLAKHGLSVIQGTVFASENLFFLATRLLHKSGEWIESTYPLPLDKSQAMGSAITYGRRYCLAAMLGIAGEPDDDGEATRTNGKAVDQPDLGSIKGDGASRHASNPLFGHLKDEMETKKNLDDLNLWWVEKQPSIKRMNSEHQQFMFIEMMKRGFDIAPERPDLRRFLISHKPEMKSLEDRSKSAWEGLQDFYDLARARLPEGAAL